MWAWTILDLDVPIELDSHCTFSLASHFGTIANKQGNTFPQDKGTGTGDLTPFEGLARTSALALRAYNSRGDSVVFVCVARVWRRE